MNEFVSYEEVIFQEMFHLKPVHKWERLGSAEVTTSIL